MFDWLDNPRAGFVLAAYAIALALLAGCLLVSWYWARTQDKKWLRLQQQRQGQGE